MTGWYEITAPSATRDMWMRPMWEGKPDLGPYTLPDGSDVTDRLAEGQLDAIPFDVWFVPRNAGRLGDLLWTGGLEVKIASTAFVNVLESIGATGYRTFKVDLRDGKERPIDGYVGFATTSASDDYDVRHLLGHQSFSFRAKVRVVEALRAEGVMGFKTERFDPAKYA